MAIDWYSGLTVLVVVLLTILYFYLTATYDYWRKLNVPYEKPSLIFGNFYPAFVFKCSISQYFYDYYNKTNERFFGIYIFRRPYLVIRDPELVKDILIKDFNHFIPRTNGAIYKNDVLGTYNIFSIKNSVNWKYLRMKLSPAFSTGKMKQMFVLMTDIGRQLNDYLKNSVGEFDVKEIKIKDCFGKFTTDVISSCGFGVQANSLIDEQAEFRKVSSKLFDYNFRRGFETICFVFVPWLANLLGTQVFSPEGTIFFKRILGNVIKTREDLNIHRPDLVDALIQLKNKGSIDGDNTKEESKFGVQPTIKFDMDVIVAQAAIFFAAGFETSASTISFTLYCLAQNPDIQDRLRKEILSILSKNNNQITYESVQEMKYLDMCIKETLRQYNTLGFLDRECEKPYKIRGTDITLRKGVCVIIPSVGLHKDPKYFPDPHKYDPERFSDENKHKIIPGTYLPFGDGPRNCIGERFGILSSKIALISMLKDFEIDSSEKPAPLIINKKAYLLGTIGDIVLKIKRGRALSEY